MNPSPESASGPARNIDWDQAAAYYDAYVRADFDQGFFLRAARAAGTPVLELMCGTGRITLPLAEAGIPITGLDSSPGLLGRFREKLLGRDLPVRLVEADARDFDLGERFPLVYIGFHALAEVLGAADRRRVFERVRAHLAPGGSFLLTLHNPPVRIAAAHRDWRPMGSALLGPGRSLEVYSRWEVAPSRGRIQGFQRYRELDASGACRQELKLPIVFDLIARDEVEEQARATGLEILRVDGDYEGSAFDPETSPFMIFNMTPKA
ncbi:MAG: methyltransferase domain-containing protein [Acidobacteria bacterium]|nr:methyltransferase domain-containing protein [Acidobacteriota bacterium]